MARTELEPVAGSRDGKPTADARARTGDRRAKKAQTAPEPVLGGPVKEVNVIGKRLDEALDDVEKALDEALVAGARLRVIHGHGTGRLRDGIREHLRKHRAVASARAADAREGGNGATMVELK